MQASKVKRRDDFLVWYSFRGGALVVHNDVKQRRLGTSRGVAVQFQDGSGCQGLQANHGVLTRDQELLGEGGRPRRMQPFLTGTFPTTDGRGGNLQQCVCMCMRTVMFRECFPKEKMAQSNRTSTSPPLQKPIAPQFPMIPLVAAIRRAKMQAKMHFHGLLATDGLTKRVRENCVFFLAESIGRCKHRVVHQAYRSVVPPLCSTLLCAVASPRFLRLVK